MRLISKYAMLIVQCKDASKLKDEEKSKMLHCLRKELRKLLFLERRAVAQKKEKKWYYELAYPKLMWCYWTCVSIFGKIRRMVKRNA